MHETGAAIGDHTSFFLDRGCTVVASEAREENIALLRARHPAVDVRKIDLDAPPHEPIMVDVVYCYGTLYHLSRPSVALDWLALGTRQLLLLETVVSLADGDAIEIVSESTSDPSQAIGGRGCRPTRGWVRRELAARFEHVYATTTQPWHEEFPLNWSSPEGATASLQRAVFVASRDAIQNPQLTESLPTVQARH